MKGDPHMWRLAARYSALGIEMAIAICLGYFGGSYLDGKLGTTPYLTYILFGCGVASAFLAIYRIGKRAVADNKRDFRDDEPGR